MVKLIKGQDNTVKVWVSNSVDITGFSASLSFGSVTKTISPLKEGTNSVVISSSEVDSIPEDSFTVAIKILDATGKLYFEQFPAFKIVEEDDTAYERNEIPIVIASTFESMAEQGGGGGDIPDMRAYVKRSDFSSIPSPKFSVNSNTSTIDKILSAAKGS